VDPSATTPLELAGAVGPRVCHVNLARGFRGGERQTELLAHGLAALGLEQRLVVRADSPLRDRLTAVEGLEIRALRSPALVRPWHTRGAEIVHAHEARAVHYAHVSRRLGGAPFVLTRRVPRRPGGNPATRAAYREADCVIAISGFIGQVIREYSPSTPVRRIPSMAAEMRPDPGRVQALRSRFGERHLLVCVGALIDRHKGQRVLLEAMAYLDDLSVRVCFVGDGPDRPRLEAEAADLPNVTFAGFVENVGDWIAAADLFVYPSRVEGLGSTLLDAMDLGRPIVASQAGGIPEVVVDGETGLLVPPGDASALAAAIRLVLTRPDVAAELVAGGAARLSEFRVGSVAERTLAVYRAVLSGDLRREQSLSSAPLEQ
jgi:glycosyltransferase involved in cell wall biosynthesis